jgi:hypothetical protein
MNIVYGQTVSAVLIEEFRVRQNLRNHVILLFRFTTKRYALMSRIYCETYGENSNSAMNLIV